MWTDVNNSFTVAFRDKPRGSVGMKSTTLLLNERSTQKTTRDTGNEIAVTDTVYVHMYYACSVMSIIQNV